MDRKTEDFKNAHYTPELIRQYEDPEYARRAEEYERRERNKVYGRRRKGRSQPDDMYGYDKKPKKHKRHRLNKLKLFRNIVVVLLLLLIAVFAYVLSITSKLDREDTDGKNFAISEQADKELDGYRNIAILGSDARKGEGYDGSRTDAVIILSIRRIDGRVKMISVMRDSYLKMRDKEKNVVFDKLTHAHAYGGGINTVATLNKNLDLNIREYVVFNWKAVADTVDCLGGIRVNVKSNEIGDLNHWGPETGRNVGRKYKKIKHTGVQTLSGVQATTYCRIRKNSGGDTGRAKRYKKVMAGVLRKAVTSPGKLGTLSNKVMPKVRTNMTQFQVATLMLRSPMLDMEKGVSWPKTFYGGVIGGVWYAVPATLSTNVKWLHRKAFDQNGFSQSGSVSKISAEIVNRTGISQGNQ